MFRATRGAKLQKNLFNIWSTFLHSKRQIVFGDWVRTRRKLQKDSKSGTSPAPICSLTKFSVSSVVLFLYILIDLNFSTFSGRNKDVSKSFRCRFKSIWVELALNFRAEQGNKTLHLLLILLLRTKNELYRARAWRRNHIRRDFRDSFPGFRRPGPQVAQKTHKK